MPWSEQNPYWPQVPPPLLAVWSWAINSTFVSLSLLIWSVEWSVFQYVVIRINFLRPENHIIPCLWRGEGSTSRRSDDLIFQFSVLSCSFWLKLIFLRSLKFKITSFLF